MGFPSTFDDALLFVLSVLFREIFIWQLLRLVLTYNFTDCDFEKIKMDYQGVILIDLNSYMIGVSKETCFFKCVFIRRVDTQKHTLKPQFYFQGKKNNWGKKYGPAFYLECLQVILKHISF